MLRFTTSIPGFLLAIVCHEAAHAYAAYRLGDLTAKSMGRLSLNPVVHFDMFGTVIIPAISLLAGGVIFGYARPVPIDPRHFKNIRRDIFWVSFAGPLANFALAVVSTLLLAILMTRISTGFSLYRPFSMMLQQSIFINMILFTFNLIPFPPLDGSKMLSVFLKYDTARKFEELQRFSILFFIILIATPIFSYLMAPVILFKSYLAKNFFLLARVKENARNRDQS